jgi:hypothetical protein
MVWCGGIGCGVEQPVFEVVLVIFQREVSFKEFSGFIFEFAAHLFFLLASHRSFFGIAFSKDR